MNYRFCVVYLALEGIYLPYSSCITKQLYSVQEHAPHPARATNRLSLPMVLHIEKKNSNSQTKHVARCSIHPWTHPSSVQCFYTLNHWVELFPFHSPLLRESCLVSFPPLINMLKFSGLPTWPHVITAAAHLTYTGPWSIVFSVDWTNDNATMLLIGMSARGQSKYVIIPRRVCNS